MPILQNAIQPRNTSNTVLPLLIAFLIPFRKKAAAIGCKECYPRIISFRKMSFRNGETEFVRPVPANGNLSRAVRIVKHDGPLCIAGHIFRIRIL